jgi:hypothetical protein
MSTNDTPEVEGTDTELTDYDGRPEECDCGAWNDGEELPCWPCYRDGFEEPNPNATGE